MSTSLRASLHSRFSIELPEAEAVAEEVKWHRSPA